VSRSIRFVRAGFALSVALFGLAAAPAGAALGGGPWSRPVSGPVVRGFDPPDSAFGPGHLGVDFAVAPGTPVHAAGDGVIVFAGRVGAALHVVTRHPGDVRTTDSFLATVAVVTGETVRRGAVLGTTGGTGAGHGAGVLHFGVRVGDGYIDPMLLFEPPDLAAVVHLAEPRRGAGSDRPPDSGARAERVAVAAELRVDGRAVAPPPAWWNDPPAVRQVTPAARAAPAVAIPTRPATGSSDDASAAIVGTSVAGTALGAAELRLRRLRRRRGPG
jgi:murein DD-endopeptidase MepM/ murein hydrolase activator NlpD